jgi:hypothetical protein
LSLRADYRRNKINVSYQIGACGFSFREAVLLRTNFRFYIIIIIIIIIIIMMETELLCHYIDDLKLDKYIL